MKIDLSPRERRAWEEATALVFGVGFGLCYFGLMVTVGGPQVVATLSVYGFLLFSVSILVIYRFGKKKKLARLTKHFQKVLKK